MSAVEQLLDRVGQAQALDRVTGALDGALRPLLDRRVVKDALSGTWLGHRLHPALIAMPIGALASSAVLDLAGGRDSEHAADELLRVGLVSALPTALAGMSDWLHTGEDAKRVGVVHASANLLATLLGVASLRARAKGRRAAGKRLALAGVGAVMAGGYVGGHLSYVLGVGVNQTAFLNTPKEWTPTLPEADLEDGQLRQADAGGVAVVLVKRDGAVHALLDRCAHLGCSLAAGGLHGEAIHCHCHGSKFRVSDGAVLGGPAASSQPALRTRVRDGMIEVRGD